MTKTALIVADALPPDRGGRAEKMWRRVYYLTKFGWDVTFLAPQSHATPHTPAIETINGCQVRVVRTSYLFAEQWPSLRHNLDRPAALQSQSSTARLLDLFFVPKGFIRWLPQAIRAGRQLAFDADVILSVNNPVSLHLIAMVIKQLTGIPWVAEFRDALVGYEYSFRGPEQINRQIERMIVQRADAVLIWDDFIVDPIADRYPSTMVEKFVRLFPTGYDPVKFSDYPSGYLSDSAKPFHITYTGSFYGDTIVPTYFLQALAKAVHTFDLQPEAVQVSFAGSWSDEYDAMVDDLNLRAYVVYCGWLTHEECIQLWQKSDSLLLILGQDEADKGLLPSKLFDYIAAQRHILALVPPGCRTARYVQDGHIGTVVEQQNTDAIASALIDLIEAHSAGGIEFSPCEQLVADNSCVNMEKRIADVLTAAAKDG